MTPLGPEQTLPGQYSLLLIDRRCSNHRIFFLAFQASVQGLQRPHVWQIGIRRSYSPAVSW